MKNKIKKFTYILMLGIAIGIIIMQSIYTFQIKKIESYDVLYDIYINTEYINVRTQPTTEAKKVFQVVQGETYNVIDVFKGTKFTWYKIAYDNDRKIGWVADNGEWIQIIE